MGPVIHRRKWSPLEGKWLTRVLIVRGQPARTLVWPGSSSPRHSNHCQRLFQHRSCQSNTSWWGTGLGTVQVTFCEGNVYLTMNTNKRRKNEFLSLICLCWNCSLVLLETKHGTRFIGQKCPLGPVFNKIDSSSPSACYHRRNMQVNT